MAEPTNTAGSTPQRPVVLHIGDAVKYNPSTYEEFSAAFHVIRPEAEERARPAFIAALKERRWGDFEAIWRPHWGSGGEMGKWDQELIELLPASVRVFASAGAGFDWADTILLGERGILYCNSGIAAAEAVADFAVIMIIGCFRALPWCMNAALFPNLATPPFACPSAEHVFLDCHDNATAASRNPRGHVLGLVGLGNIGQTVAARFHQATFGMKIHYHDVERKTRAVEASLDATFHASIESLVAVADVVVLAAPADPAGKPLVTRPLLSRFKKGSRFVNVARGSLVDEDALADALEDGTIEAAALDVHAHEPRVNRRLVALAATHGPPCVMLTCHNAGGTVDTHRGFEELTMRNILAVLSGGAAMTPVNTHFLKKKKKEQD